MTERNEALSEIKTVDLIKYLISNRQIDKRFYAQIYDNHIADEVREVTERNDTPEQEWLEVWASIRDAAHEGEVGIALDSLSGAVMRLYLLLEPPSVREKRINHGL